MPLPLIEPPRSLCLLRLSAIGDTCHVVPLLRVLQDAWPDCRMTWVIGRIEAKLMQALPGVEFIIVDKRGGWRSLRQLRRSLRGRRFDVLLHLQLALRASLYAAQIPARVRLGFDRARARELQWLFTNARIEPRSREHVQDSFMGFARALGIRNPVPRWDFPLPADACQYAAQLIGEEQRDRTLILSACSSHSARNWDPARYAAVAEHAVRRHGMQVILTGGPAALERQMADDIRKLCREPLVDTVGRDTLLQLLAVIARARVLLTPDSGPAHMATLVNTPVLGLYAATNPARSGPWRSRDWCVDAYDAAARQFHQRTAADLPWTTKIERPGVMDLISVAAVCERLDRLMAQQRPANIPA
jgi:heptosyltransferase I